MIELVALNGRHEGRDVFILATGPSLVDFDYSPLEGQITIGVNDFPINVAETGFAPTYHAFSDASLWSRYKDHDYKGVSAIVCQKQPCERLRAGWDHRRNGSREAPLVCYKNIGNAKLVKMKNNHLHCGRTVANTGILLAWRMGAARIFLLGVDCFRFVPHPDKAETPPYYMTGRPHRRSQPNYEMSTHEDGTVLVMEKRQKGMRDSLFAASRDVYSGLYPGPWPGRGVYNLSKYSLVSCFEKVTLAQALEVPCSSKTLISWT